MAYGSEGGENVGFKHKKTNFLLYICVCVCVCVMFLHFKDHLSSFKFHTHSFLNHSTMNNNFF